MNSLDAQFADLRIWRDINGNHQTDAGELMTLAQAGIASLKVSFVDTPTLDAQGNLLGERSSATLANGHAVDMIDVYFNVARADADAAGVALPTLADLLGDTRSLDAVLGCAVQAPISMAADSHADRHTDGMAETHDVLRRLAALTREDSHAAYAG